MSPLPSTATFTFTTDSMSARRPSPRQPLHWLTPDVMHGAPSTQISVRISTHGSQLIVKALCIGLNRLGTGRVLCQLR